MAIDECHRAQSPENIPCMIISSWKPSVGCSGELEIYSETGNLLATKYWDNHTIYCNTTFNYTGMQTYVFNSSIEDGVIQVIDSGTWLLGILILPLGLSFLFIYWAQSLSEEQEPFKWFMRFLALIMVFVLFVGADMIIEMHPSYSQLAELFNIVFIQWIFYALFALFLVYFIWRIALAMKIDRDNDLEKGFLR